LTLIIEVDRDVPIALAGPEYRAGTARSTLSEFQSLFVIGISQNAISLREPFFCAEVNEQTFSSLRGPAKRNIVVRLLPLAVGTFDA
jgi:hypothetical protein